MAAAADLSLLEQPLRDGFARVSPTPVRFSFGSSGLLARQIENGAPFDVFLAAQDSLVTLLVARGFVAPDSVRPYARGRLALWSKSGTVRRLEDLLGDWVRHVALANPAHAPYGVAARQVLERQNLWRRLEPKVVYGENVRQALQFAESGNAEAALVSLSLVVGRGGLVLPADWHAPILQTAGVVRRGRRPEEARRFVEWLLTDAAQQVFAAYGFDPPARQGNGGGADSLRHPPGDAGLRREPVRAPR